MCCIIIRFHNGTRAKYTKVNCVYKKHTFMLKIQKNKTIAITAFKCCILIFKSCHFIIYLQVLPDVKEFLAPWAECKIT